jgi:UDP-glucose 4-epimerase
VNPQARFYQVDIRSTELGEVMEKERPEAVCHLAAQHSVKISTDDPRHDAEVNILGLINLLQAATRVGTRKVIFSSSGATYGTVEKMPVDEQTPQHPESPYGITKMTSEYYFRFWKEMHGLNFTLLRYGNVYGPRQDPTGEAGVIAIFARRILFGEPVRIDWDGEQQKDYVYAGDVARVQPDLPDARQRLRRIASPRARHPGQRAVPQAVRNRRATKRDRPRAQRPATFT